MIRNDRKSPIPKVGDFMQLALTFEPRQLARCSDPITSHMAAERVREFASGHCQVILDTLKKHGPLTVDEIAKRSALMSQQVNKRLPDLRREGAVELTGHYRLSASGRMERVWAAT